MPVTYTNRKGYTYYLCRGVNKRGNAYYRFAREVKGEPVDEIPEGYRVDESVNGVVSLVKDRPLEINPEEMAAVEAALARHPKARNYRVSAKDRQLLIYERVGPDADQLVAHFGGLGLFGAGAANLLREEEDRYAQFTPVMRFTLTDPERRTFRAERWCYLGSIDDWIEIGPQGPLRVLARRFTPLLGTDRLYDVHL
jgi:hypothetical protein